MTGPTATELDVECPACGAIPGEPCHGKVKRSHLRRRSAEVWAILSKDLPSRRERQLWLLPPVAR